MAIKSNEMKNKLSTQLQIHQLTRCFSQSKSAKKEKKYPWKYSAWILSWLYGLWKVLSSTFSRRRKYTRIHRILFWKKITNFLKIQKNPSNCGKIQIRNSMILAIFYQTYRWTILIFNIFFSSLLLAGYLFLKYLKMKL